MLSDWGKARLSYDCPQSDFVIYYVRKVTCCTEICMTLPMHIVLYEPKYASADFVRRCIAETINAVDLWARYTILPVDINCSQRLSLMLHISHCLCRCKCCMAVPYYTFFMQSSKMTDNLQDINLRESQVYISLLVKCRLPWRMFC